MTMRSVKAEFPRHSRPSPKQSGIISSREVDPLIIAIGASQSTRPVVIAEALIVAAVASRPWTSCRQPETMSVLF